MKHSIAFEKLAEESRAKISEVTPEQVLEKLSNNHPFHFIDVREDHEWLEGHAYGATHIGRGIIERDIENKIPDKDDLLVLYCGGGFRSALAADNLLKMGYKQVLSMAGGIRLWREKAYPEQKS